MLNGQASREVWRGVGGGMLLQTILKLRGSETKFFAFSWRYVLGRRGGKEVLGGGFVKNYEDQCLPKTLKKIYQSHSTWFGKVRFISGDTN